MKAYNRLYYGILSFYMKYQSGNETPDIIDALIALVIMSVFVFVDIVSLISLLKCLSFPSIKFTKWLGIGLAAFVLAINILQFISQKRYLRQYYYYHNNETTKQHKTRATLCVAFIVLSIALVFVIPN